MDTPSSSKDLSPALRSRFLIDPPSDFAPVEDWRAHLASLKEIDDPDEVVLRAIKKAENRIAEED